MLDQAFPIATIAGIRVRVHLAFVLFVVFDLTAAAFNGQFVYGLVQAVSLFVLVLLHEFGHCVACRWVGGTADNILMWPLGGLASCRPPHTWKAHLVTVLGGPGVNVLLVPVLGGAMLLLGMGTGSVLFNPLDPNGALRALGPLPLAKVMLFWVYFVNLALLGFNVLLPMFPMDGGRIWQCILWSRLGWRRSMGIAIQVGIVCAVVVGVFGVTAKPPMVMLVLIALFAGLTCWQEQMRLRAIDAGSDFGEEGDSPVLVGSREESRDAWRTVGKDEEQRAAEARRRREAAAKEQEELDRILAKIAAQGMGSLTGRERSFLTKTTDRKRGGGGP